MVEDSHPMHCYFVKVWQCMGEAALVILAMNASCRLAHWLVHFFCRLLSPPGFLVFQQTLR